MAINKKPITLPTPDLQVNFSAHLAAARKSFLIEALSDTVKKLNIPDIDVELAKYVEATKLRDVAAVGLRGELVFPVPIILNKNPRLLSYYRLLLGHSQKTFYLASYGTSSFKCMEDAGILPKNTSIDNLCECMINRLSLLIDGIGTERLNRDLLDDLTLLTLGPQLRGGENVRKGTAGIQAIFELIHNIVSGSVISARNNALILENAAKRRVLIQFAPDPDIVIQETKLDVATRLDVAARNIIAIEIKAGTDFSNIHNRIGEAEKSHQKAHIAGYAECWTIVNVPNLDIKKAMSESPSTNRFYRLTELIQADTKESIDFRNRILSLTGLPDNPAT